MAKLLKLTLSEVNSLSYEDFIRTFGNVVEKCPLIAAAVWDRRPFSGVHQLQAAFEEVIDDITFKGNERLLRLFVPIGVSGNLSEESQRERASAGVTVLTKEEDKLLSELNAKYKTAFGFPFIICARENKKESILQSLQRRLKNSQKSEAMIGLIEVKKICKLRIQDLVSENVLSKL